MKTLLVQLVPVSLPLALASKPWETNLYKIVWYLLDRMVSV